jgi:transcriptional regulator with XRE-family HTH domain
MEIRAILASNIKRLRAHAGLSQEELADRVGIDRTYVSALERKIYAASIDLVARMAAALGVEAYELLREPAETMSDGAESGSRR